MELILLDPHLGHFLIRHFDPGWVFLLIQRRLNRQTGICLCIPDQAHDYRATRQRPTTPIPSDVTEHPMLNLVPLARPRRKMADTYS